MNVTNNLKLPQYTEEDTFDLQDINKAYSIIDNAYKEVIDIKDEITKTNATAEVIDARGGKETLGKRLDEFGSQLDTIVRSGVSIKEFNSNENLTDYTDVFNLAFDHAFKTGVNICIPEGKYIVRGGITCSPLIHIIPIGRVEIEDIGTEYDYTMKVQSLDNEDTSTDKYFQSPSISNAFGDIHFINKSGVAKTGIYTTGRSESGLYKRNNLYLQGVTFEKYNKGLHIDSHSTYIMTYEKLLFRGCDYGVYYGNTEGTSSNTGEKIYFNNCLFTNTKTAIYNNSAKAELVFNNCSIDMCGCGVVGGKAIKIDFNHCHFEAIGVGANYIESNSDFEGIVKVDDSDNDYDRTFVTVKNSIIVMHGTSKNLQNDEFRYPSTQLFIGSRMILTLDDVILDYGYEYWWKNTIFTDSPSLKLFMVNNGVKKISIKNVKGLYNRKPFIIHKESILNYPYFLNDDIQSFTIENHKVTNANLKEFEINDSLNIFSASIENDEELNQKVIAIQCTYDNTNSWIELISKKSYPIVGKDFDGFLLMKGYKGKKYSNIGLNANARIKLVWYDSDDNELGESELFSTYRVFDNDDGSHEEENIANSNKWMTGAKSRSELIDIYKGATKYKIKVKLVANNGDNIYNKVYFTGIYVFNY